MNYKNLTFYYEAPEFISLTNAYFQKENITIGQVTRKLWSYFQALARLRLSNFNTYRCDFRLGYRDIAYVASNGRDVPDLSSCYLDINLRARHENAGMFNTGTHLWKIRIGYRFPSTFLFPFFKRFWDNNPYMDGIPIKSSSITTLTSQGIFQMTQEFYLGEKEPRYAATGLNTFAILSIYREKASLTQKLKGKWNGWIWGKKHYEVLDVHVDRRDNCHRDKSVLITVDKLIKQLSGRSFLLGKS